MKSTDPLTLKEWAAARNSSWRRETRKPDGSIRQRAGSLRYLYGKARETVDTSLDFHCPSPTACWKPAVTRSGRFYHEIKVSPRLPMSFDLRHDKLRIALVKSAVAHEVAHGLYTDRDLKGVASILADKGLPFALLNLFEDCRIEHLYTAERGIKDHQFGWRHFIDCGTVKSNPAEWLLAMKMREPYLFKTPASVMARYTFSGPATCSDLAPGLFLTDVRTRVAPAFRPSPKTTFVVRAFYEQIIQTASTKDLIPLIEEWVRVFGSDMPTSPVFVNIVDESVGGVPDPKAPKPTEVDQPVDHTAHDGTITGVSSTTTISRGGVMYDNIMNPVVKGFSSLKDYFIRE